MRLAFAAVILALLCLPAKAQQNCPATPAAGTSNTTCANTAFVQKQIAVLPGIGLTLSGSTLNLKQATSSVLGGVECDGVTIICTGGVISTNIRQMLAGTAVSQNTYNYYANGSTGSDSNPGTSGSPWQHCQYGIDYLSMNIDLHAQNVVLNCLDTSADTTGLVLRNIVGLYDNWPTPTLVLVGNTSSLVSLNCGANVCITAQGTNASGWLVKGFAFNSSVSWIHADAGARIIVGKNSGTGNPTYPFESSYNGSIIELVDNITDLDTAETSFARITFGGQFITAGTPTITLNHDIAYGANGFYSLAIGATVNVSGVIYAGAGASGSTGDTFNITGNSTLNSAVCSNNGSQGNSAYIPGDTNGVTSTGGQCL